MTGQPYVGLHDSTGTQLLPLLVEPSSDPILIEKVTIDPPDVRDASDSRPQASGVYDRTRFTGAAAVTIEGTFVGDDSGAPWSYADQMKRLSQPDSPLYLHLRRYDWDQARRILIRGDKPSADYSDMSPAFQFGYKAPAGTLEALTEVELPIFPINLASPGLSEPISEPVFTAPGGVAGGLQFTNDSTASRCFPVIDVYGPATGIVAIQYLNTGEVWQSRAGSLIEAGHFWRIDFDAHTVHLDGDPSLSRTGQFDFINSTWWGLEPGDGEVSLTIEFPGAGCHALLRYRPRYAI